MNKITKAVIPVAGFGTRFLPITKAVPKMMLPIVDKPILQLIAEEAADSGITEILFIVGNHSEIIEDYFTRNEELLSRLTSPSKHKYYTAVDEIDGIASFSFVIQEQQLGTGHAVALSEEFVGGEPFLLMFGDDLMFNATDPVSQQLIRAYEKTGKTVLGCKKVPVKDVPKYASVEYDRADGNIYYVTKITEKPAPQAIKSDLAPLGRYVLTPDIFGYLRKLKPGIGGEYQITDAFDAMAAEGKVVACAFDGMRYDTGDKLGYLKAVVDFSLRDEEVKEEFLAYIKEK